MDIGALLEANEFWLPPLGPDSTWLYEEVFPLVKAFLLEHGDHGIIFVESGNFFDRDDFYSWVEIEKG